MVTGVPSCFRSLTAALFDMTAPLPLRAQFLADLILRPAEEPSLLHDFNKVRGIPQPVDGYGLQESRLALPEGWKAEYLYRNTFETEGYEKAVKEGKAENFEGYKSELYALEASQAACQALIVRMQRATAGATLESAQEQRRSRVMKEFRKVEGERKAAGFLFVDELAPLREKIREAHASAIGAVLGADPTVRPLSDAEKASLRTPELENQGPFTIKDRLKDAGVELMPEHQLVFGGLYKVNDAPSAIVVVDRKLFRMTILPLNPAAIAYYHTSQPVPYQLGTLSPVSFDDLLELQKKATAP
jgi:hypothetical protein